MRDVAEPNESVAKAPGRFISRPSPSPQTPLPCWGEGLQGAGARGAGAVYLMASMGLSRDALNAGYIPNTTASTSAVSHAIRSPIGLTTSP